MPLVSLSFKVSLSFLLRPCAKPSISHSNFRLQLCSSCKHDIYSCISIHPPSLRPACLCPLPQSKMGRCLFLPVLDCCPLHLYYVVDGHQWQAVSSRLLPRGQVYVFL